MGDEEELRYCARDDERRPTSTVVAKHVILFTIETATGPSSHKHGRMVDRYRIG